MLKRHDKKRERKDAYPKEGMPHDMSKKKRKKYNIYIAHVQENKYKERDRSSNGVHPLSTKNIPHICTS